MSNYFNRQWRLPNAWNGTESNVNKQSNYSLSFDGTEYVSITDGVLLNSSGYTLSMWFNANSFSSVQVLVFDTSSDLKFISIDSATSIRVRDGSSNGSSFTVPSMSVDNWYNIIVSVNNGSCKVYLNSTESTTSAKTVNQNWTINGINGYSNTHGGSFNFIGKIDAVAIFNFALSQGQITTLYGSSSTGIGNPMSLSPKPVFYAPLGDQDVYNGADYLVPNNSLQDYVFNFNQDTINIANGSTIARQQTISYSAWVNADSLTTTQYIVGNSSVLTGGTGIYISNTGAYPNRLVFQIGDPVNFSTQSYLNSAVENLSNYVNINEWFHVAASWDGTTSKIYINGIERSTWTPNQSTNTYTIANWKNGFVIGRNTTNVDAPFSGELSNIAFWDVGLTPAQVTTIYNNGTPVDISSLSPVSWWKLNAQDTFDGTNWTIKDYAGSNDGTSSGMTSANLVQSNLQHTSGYSPYALDFDGALDWITVPSFMSNLPSNDIYSISTWVKTRVDTACIWGSSSTSNLLYAYVTNGTKLGIGRGSVTRVDISNALTVGEWANLVAVFDSSTNLKIYINNVFIQNVTVGSLGAVTDNFQIAGALNAYPLDCLQSNCSFWNAALTSAQVTEIYNSGVPSNLNNHSAVSSLVSWWQLGSNSSFDTNWTVLNEISTAPNGVSQNMTEVDIVNGVGYSSNGVSSGMSDNVVGSAPYSTANSLSINMDVLDRTTDIPS
tara:strand:+ start:2127 stop:4289 length:2163 start_codon:yes stop_codon:yes gene_type:complete